MRNTTELELDGFVVNLFRAKDGTACVAIDTTDAEGEDVQGEHAIPRLRVIVNDDADELDAAGRWVKA